MTTRGHLTDTLTHQSAARDHESNPNSRTLCSDRGLAPAAQGDDAPHDLSGRGAARHSVPLSDRRVICRGFKNPGPMQ